jgi:hypothetical protein
MSVASDMCMVKMKAGLAACEYLLEDHWPSTIGSWLFHLEWEQLRHTRKSASVYRGALGQDMTTGQSVYSLGPSPTQAFGLNGGHFLNLLKPPVTLYPLDQHAG